MVIYLATYTVKYQVHVQADTPELADDEAYSLDLPDLVGHEYVEDSFDLLKIERV